MGGPGNPGPSRFLATRRTERAGCMAREIRWTHEFRYPDQGWTLEKCRADEAAHRRADAPWAEGWRTWMFRPSRPDEGEGPGALPDCPIIDFHTHAWTDSFAPHLIPRFVEAGGATPFDPGTIDGLRERKRKLGVTKSVVLPVPTKPSQVPRYNDWLVDFLDDPDIIPFMSVHPAMEDPAAEVRRCARLGFKGMKLHPVDQRFRMTDPAMFPVYEAAIDAGMVILFHTGFTLDAAASGPDWDCSPAEIARWYELFPYERTVLAHLSGSDRSIMDTPAPDPAWPGYLDLAFQLGRQRNEDVLRIVRGYGVDRVVFGTDSPWEWTEDYLVRLAHVGFTEEELRAILYGNAARLLGL